MALPETAEQALAAWKAKQTLEAVTIGPPGSVQAQQWGMVFDIVEAAPPATRSTLQQFEAWCWNSMVGFPELATLKTPAGGATAAGIQTAAQTEAAGKRWQTAQSVAMAEFGKRTEIRVMAFSILREGFANVIRRRRQTNPASAIMVRKP